MRLVTILLFTTFSVAAQESLHLEVRDLGKINSFDSALVYKFINKSSKVVYLTSKATDSVFFNLINQYRIGHNVNPLPNNSIRLDTLAHQVLLKNTAIPQLTHYSKLPEFSADLLNVENLNRMRIFDLNVRSKDLRFVIEYWDQSPSHQKNLLDVVGDFENDVAAAHLILKIDYCNNEYRYMLYAIYELDNQLSKREYNQKVDDVNKFLLNRSPKPKRK